MLRPEYNELILKEIISDELVGEFEGEGKQISPPRAGNPEILVERL
jgi:hypothetical protein